jgi:hypothetical protein
VQGLTEAQIQTLAAGILAANSTPTRQIDYVVLPLTEETIGRALLDLYDLVTVTTTARSLHHSLRIVKVTHTITATNKGSKWLLKLDFTGDGTAAPPQVIPKPSAGSGASAPGWHGHAPDPLGRRQHERERRPGDHVPVLLRYRPHRRGLPGDDASGLFQISVEQPTVTTAGFTVHCRTATGGAVVSSIVRINYTAEQA